jgi:hypothetical protein
MATPPVHHPSDPDHERRVRWGLALVTLGSILPLTAGPQHRTLWSSMFCRVSDCAVPAGDPAYLASSYVVTPALLTQWAVYVASVFLVGSVTIWWWTGASGPRAVATAEFCALFGLAGWFFVVPAAPQGWVVMVPGGVLAALGTAGLFARDDHDAATFTAELAAGGGVLFWTGLTLAALTGAVPVFAPLVYAPLLVCFLVLCAAPLSWIRSHLLVFVAAPVFGAPAQAVLGPSTAPDPVSAPPPDSVQRHSGDVLAHVAGDVAAGVVVVGAGVVLGAALADIAFQWSPSLVERVPALKAE